MNEKIPLPPVRYRLFKVIIHTSDAFILYLIAMFAAYLLTAWKPNMPFLAYATQITLGLGALLAKRHLANKAELQNGQNKP